MTHHESNQLMQTATALSPEQMRADGIGEILMHDNHFTQEGFTILL